MIHASSTLTTSVRFLAKISPSSRGHCAGLRACRDLLPSPFSAHNLRYLVETRSRSCLLVRRPPPFSSKTSLSFSVTSVTSPRPKSPFTPCYPPQTYRFTILRPASPPNCQLLIRKEGRAREDVSSMSRMRKTEDSFFSGVRDWMDVLPSFLSRMCARRTSAVIISL